MGLPKLFPILMAGLVTASIFQADARADGKEEDPAKALFKKLERHSCVRTDTDLLYARKIEGHVLRDVFYVKKYNASYTCLCHAREAEFIVSQDGKTVVVCTRHVHVFLKDDPSPGFIGKKTWEIDPNVQSHPPAMAEQHQFMEIERLIVEWEKANP